MAITDLSIGALIGISVITTIIMIPLSALLLMLSTKIFKLKNSSYGTAFIVALLVGVAALVLNIIGTLSNLKLVMSVLSFVLVSVLLSIWMVKTKYNVEWGKAALVWLIWLIFNFVLAFIISLIVGIIVAVMLIGGFSATVGAG